jgi:GNAT superfamily N-acetyltransferase
MPRPTAADINRFFRGGTYGDYDIFTPASYHTFVQAHDLDLANAVNRYDASKLIGTLVYGIRGERAWFALIGVDRARRRGGLGGELVDDALARVLRQGVRTVELEIVQRNAAARNLFYARGFEPREELLVWSRRARRAATSRTPLEHRRFSIEEVERVAHFPSSCWQREPRSVARSGALALIDVPGAYAFVRMNGDGGMVVDGGAASHKAAAELLSAIDHRVAGEMTLNNERADSPLSQALHDARWRVVERQHRILLG